MKKTSKYLVTMVLAGLVAACGSSSSGDSGNAPADDFSVRLDLPDSLTGGKYIKTASEFAEAMRENPEAWNTFIHETGHLLDNRAGFVSDSTLDLEGPRLSCRVRPLLLLRARSERGLHD